MTCDVSDGVGRRRREDQPHCRLCRGVALGRSLVMLNCFDPVLDFPAVLPDDRSAGRLAVAQLLDQEHSDGIHVVGSVAPSRVAGNDRVRGAVDFLSQWGLSLAGVSECDWVPEAAKKVTLPVLRRSASRRPTAIIAMNERVALGVYQARRCCGSGDPRRSVRDLVRRLGSG